MSTRDREDDQIRWQNKKEDAKYARTQEERRSEIAKGFSHNTDALYALYGYRKEQPIYPAGYEEEVRNEVLRRRDRLLSELSEWPKFHLQQGRLLKLPFKGLSVLKEMRFLNKFQR